MRIFLAGGASCGNLSPAWKALSCKKDINLENFKEALIDEGFLAGGESRHFVHDDLIANIEKGDDMKVYLAGVSPYKEKGIYDNIISTHHPYILESFFYIDDITEKMIPIYGDFMLDSGAFTYFSSPKKGEDINWEEYIVKYADYINRNKIEKFFELDIDVIVGYEKVLEYRKKLEELTNRKCIPVWHISRGIEEYKKMLEEYDYIALGGLVSKEWSKKAEENIPILINMAHKKGVKVHGLGFTKLEKLKDYHFDSVDSSSWTAGNRFGFLFKFKNGKLEKIRSPKEMRLNDPRKVAIHNYTEWLKFQKWAEVNL